MGIVSCLIPNKNQAWEDLHRLTLDKDSSIQWRAAHIIGAGINNHYDKNQLCEDLYRPIQDEESSILQRAEYALSIAFPDIHEKDLTWRDLHLLTHNIDWIVRRDAAYALSKAFPHIPDRIQAWNDLCRLTQDEYSGVRQQATYALGIAFPNVPDKIQSWNYLRRLIEDKDSGVRQNAAYAMGAASVHIPDKIQAWNDIYRLTQDKDRDVQLSAIYALGTAFPYMTDRNQAWNDLHRLIHNRDWYVRQGAAYALGIVFSQIPDKNHVWEDLIRLTQDKKSVLWWRAVHALKVTYLREPINQDEIHRKAISSEIEERREALYLLGNCFAFLHDKTQAWEDLQRLSHDEYIGIQESAICTMSIVFPHCHEKKQIWEDLIQITKHKEIILRHHAINSISNIFIYMSHFKQAWEDLQSLTLDDDDYIRQCAAESLGIAFSRISNEDKWWALEILVSVFPHIPDKKQACENLIQMTQDKSSSVRLRAIYALFTIFPQVTDKEQVWKDFIRLTQDEDSVVRSRAASGLVSTFPYIIDKEQAWYDLQRLMQDKDSEVRSHVASALGVIFPKIDNKEQVCNDLIRLTHDKICNVRVSANYSLGRAFLLKATEANNKENFKKELEKALEFFEKSSQESSFFNPASFCLPFYRSFYTLIFKKQEVESEVRKYLGEAKNAVRGSESREKLLQTVENLANALREVQNARDFDEMKCALKVYTRYLEHAADILVSTEDNAPGATKLIRKGLPIIDERIREIIIEIQHKAKAIYNETKETPLEDIALKNCKIAQDLSFQDPLALGVGLGRMIETARSFCEYIKPKDKRRDAYETLKSLENMEISAQLYAFLEVFDFISKNSVLPRIQTLHISETKKEVVRVAVIQFCYELTNSFPPVIETKDAVKAKIFSGLEMAKKETANIACLPELCLCEEWIPEIEKNYPEMIVIGGGFYKDNRNVCPVITKSDIEIFSQSKITPAAPEDPEMWKSGMVPGDRIYKYETQFGKFVILICRDFERFAHYFRESDIDFIFCPAYNDANERFHVEANNHVAKTPSYILIANTGIYGGSSIFGQLNKNYFDRLVGEGCKKDGDMSFKLCEAEKNKNEIIFADFNLIHKSIQIPAPSESSNEKRSVTHIEKLRIP
ncbi:MAG: hypothetical protein Q8M95_06260 [Candidatus Methanoperedens sp.]|nr:hypothetical protein [Candidatus Methanoperedens sp.]